MRPLRLTVGLLSVLAAPGAAQAPTPVATCPPPPANAAAPRDISTLPLAGEWRLVLEAAHRRGPRAVTGTLTLLRSDSVRPPREAGSLATTDTMYWLRRPLIGWADIDTSIGVGGSRNIASRDLAAPGVHVPRGTRTILLGLVPAMDGYATQLRIDHVRPDTLWGSWEVWYGIELVPDPAHGRFCAVRVRR